MASHSIRTSAHTLEAPAKINLSLHVEGRRSDGYHELRGLVAFADIGDELHLQKPGPDQSGQWSLQCKGPFAAQLAGASNNPDDNLVIRAAALYAKRASCELSGLFTLTKNLPIASGIGGGSSDAAAALRLLQNFNPNPLSTRELARLAMEIGADVPMCLTPKAQLIAGRGEVLWPLRDFPALPAVLVNPRVPVSTKTVFETLSAPQLVDHFKPKQPALPKPRTPSAMISYLHEQRNDLQAPALKAAPVISKILKILANDKNCDLARMSGSGATCFGLYESEEIAGKAASSIADEHREWWVAATVLL